MNNDRPMPSTNAHTMLSFIGANQPNSRPLCSSTSNPAEYMIAG